LWSHLHRSASFTTSAHAQQRNATMAPSGRVRMRHRSRTSSMVTASPPAELAGDVAEAPREQGPLRVFPRGQGLQRTLFAHELGGDALEAAAELMDEKPRGPSLAGDVLEELEELRHGGPLARSR